MVIKESLIKDTLEQVIFVHYNTERWSLFGLSGSDTKISLIQSVLYRVTLLLNHYYLYITLLQ